MLIQTRWHEDDLAGWLIKEHASEGWKVISMPAIAETDGGWRVEGDALWPERYPLETLARIREAVGTAAWISLYQQRPAPEEGAIFKKDWFKSVRRAARSHAHYFLARYCFQGRPVERLQRHHNHLRSENRLPHQACKSWPLGISRTEGPSRGAGRHLATDCRPGRRRRERSIADSGAESETRLPILPVKPQGDKVSRAHAVSPLVESGRVVLPPERRRG